MNVDDLDLQIIYCIITSGTELTTCDIAKVLFDPKNKYELQKVSNKISYRLAKLNKYGFITVKNGSTKKSYGIKRENVHADDCFLRIGECDFFIKNAIVLKYKDQYHFFFDDSVVDKG